MIWESNVNKYIGVILGFLSVVALVPRMEAISRGTSLFIPLVFVGWAVITFILSLLRNQPTSPEVPSLKNRKKA
jgi:uncharacterized membrane protein HdeD (DUF308 family)